MNVWIVCDDSICWQGQCSCDLKHVRQKQSILGLQRTSHETYFRCAWKVLNLYLTQAAAHDDANTGAAIAVQSFGDLQNFNLHLHVLATDDCFYNDAALWPRNQEGLENLSRYIIRAYFSQEHMTYIPAQDSYNGVAKVICQSKDGNTSKTFDAIHI